MMADMDLGLKRPSNFPIATLDKLLVVIGEVDIGPRPATIPPITQVTIVDCWIYLLLIVMLIILFMKMKEIIVDVMVKDVGLGIKISATIHFIIMEKLLMVMREVYIGLRIAPLPPIIQVILVDSWVFIVMVLTEVNISLIPEIFLYITIVEYTFTIKCSIKKIFRGACKEKIYIKIILIILIQE